MAAALIGSNQQFQFAREICTPVSPVNGIVSAASLFNSINNKRMALSESSAGSLRLYGLVNGPHLGLRRLNCRDSMRANSLRQIPILECYRERQDFLKYERKTLAGAFCPGLKLLSQRSSSYRGFRKNLDHSGGIVNSLFEGSEDIVGGSESLQGSSDNSQSTPESTSPGLFPSPVTLYLVSIGALASAALAAAASPALAAAATDQVAAAPANAPAAGQPGKGRRAPRVMALEERVEWSRGLPTVIEKVPYSDVMAFQEEGRLKHIIKHPNSALQENPDRVLIVLQDDRVVRTMLPPLERDPQFWAAWQEHQLGELVVDAFTPPPPPIDGAPWGKWGPSLSSLNKLSEFLRGLGKGIDRSLEKEEGQRSKPVKKMTARERAQMAAQEKLAALERERRERELARAQRDVKMRAERDAQAKRKKEEAKRLQRQEREAEQQRADRARKAARLAKRNAEWKREDAERERKLTFAVQAREKSSQFWSDVSKNEYFRLGMGLAFFVAFYYFVVLNIKMRKKDFDDRLKLREAEDEERRKMEEEDADIDMEQDLAAVQDTQGRSGLSPEEQQRLQLEEQSNEQLKMSKKFMRSGAKIKRKSNRFKGVTVDVKFSDVAGLGKIRYELEEIVDFFNYSEKYKDRGSHIPSGILLCGEPGTGKTLLAKAVAGEAGVNFFSISASQFVEIYAGVGASRVRALYTEARACAPSVIFIDELDAVGRLRGIMRGSGGQERDSTLNQLLMCLDGFEGKGDVITIAATNRDDILDPALVRPGRFDRKIYIPKPSRIGRSEILEVHARNKPVADDVDFVAVADVTEGMSGAELASLLDHAALRALREGRSEISTDDLLEAVLMVEGGSPNPDIPSPQRMRQLALNEVATAVVASNFPNFNEIQFITIVPRVDEEKGSVRFKPDPTVFVLQGTSRRVLMDYVTINMAPRAADILWNGSDNLCTIWADSVEFARSTARNIVTQGLLDLPNLYGFRDTIMTPQEGEIVDQEAQKILQECHEHATQLLIRNRTLVEVTVEALLTRRSLPGSVFAELVKQHGDFDPPPPDLVKIREEKVAQFRESMIANKRSAAKEAAAIA